ncbi:MAG: hypothetical protein SOT81_09600 [Treponema sp.]|nr:hypothetical protein [Treponema sp.]
MKEKIINIHGDNIVECERALSLCKKSLQLQNLQLAFNSSVFCPSYSANNDFSKFCFTFYPGYGRWNFDILQYLQTNENSLREAPDVIITEIIAEKEIPLVAIEYCGALPAGNQAWQRSGRGYSAGMSKIPYLYIAEIGGYELDENRNRKAARLPNPAVPFSYLSYSHNRHTVLPVYEKSAGCDEDNAELYKDVFSENELENLVRKIISNKDFNSDKKALENKVLKFIQIKAATSKGKSITLSADEWQKAYKVICSNESLISFLCKENPISWQKTAYIENLTESAEKFMKIASKYAIGITSKNLPMCIIPNQNKEKFLKETFELYKNLTDEFKAWIINSKNLVITWIMGFKPHGDDARPDRGLVPFSRMLTGSESAILTFVYGPVPKKALNELESNPKNLGKENGIWEAIFSASDALLVDSATSDKKICYIKQDFQLSNSSDFSVKEFVQTIPKRIGENDVDTILHTLFTNIKSLKIFEGVCNPPGGDWSGISILENGTEYRWLSLPRVSKTEAKRPDHVFEIFGIAEKPILLSVESKETAAALEKDIGRRLNQYLIDLAKNTVSAEHKNNSSDWKISSHKISIEDYILVSAAAYICKKENDFKTAESKVNCDIIFTYVFDEEKNCTIKMSAYSEIGKSVIESLAKTEEILNGLSLVKV